MQQESIVHWALTGSQNKTINKTKQTKNKNKKNKKKKRQIFVEANLKYRLSCQVKFGVYNCSANYTKSRWEFKESPLT